MKQVQRGFTLIELVMVIVILGVLSAVALPKFVDLKGDAEVAAAAGVSGGLSSAATVNYAGCAAKNQVVTANFCVKVSKCSEVGPLTGPATTFSVAAAVPGTTTKGTVYMTTAADTALATNGSTANCVATYGNGAAGNAITFAAIGAGN